MSVELYLRDAEAIASQLPWNDPTVQLLRTEGRNHKDYRDTSDLSPDVVNGLFYVSVLQNSYPDDQNKLPLAANQHPRSGILTYPYSEPPIVFVPPHNPRTPLFNGLDLLQNLTCIDLMRQDGGLVVPYLYTRARALDGIYGVFETLDGKDAFRKGTVRTFKETSDDPDTGGIIERYIERVPTPTTTHAARLWAEHPNAAGFYRAVVKAHWALEEANGDIASVVDSMNAILR